jgi:hypothetical protein
MARKDLTHEAVTLILQVGSVAHYRSTPIAIRAHCDRTYGASGASGTRSAPLPPRKRTRRAQPTTTRVGLFPLRTGARLVGVSKRNKS